jgi:hypothetical protein
MGQVNKEVEIWCWFIALHLKNKNNMEMICSILEDDLEEFK